MNRGPVVSTNLTLSLAFYLFTRTQAAGMDVISSYTFNNIIMIHIFMSLKDTALKVNAI